MVDRLESCKVRFLQISDLYTVPTRFYEAWNDKMLARSYTGFFVTLKYSSNFCTTWWYSFFCSAVMFVVASTSSASSPMQYIKLLTCCSSDSAESPEANRNCSN